jgi:predicted dehydrogenase|tara:strand:- start:107 stop:1024 length:918 start_codon:yes stop_codon:yes gene_type:complete
MKIGIIGNGNHSKRIQKILKKKKIDFFIYKPKKPDYFEIHKFNQLKKCNVIFIVSPNMTHFFYIKKLYKKRYIFCEKPPVNTKKELSELKKIKSKKIYFNYNLRFSNIAKVLKNTKKYKLGKLIYANISSSHGLAQKKDYKINWRSNIRKSPKGIYEIVSIHFVDLINYLFSVSKIEKPDLINSSKIGNSYDTSLVKIKLKNGALINIFSTYNSSYCKNHLFLFKNGILEQKDDIIKIKGPTKNLDDQGFFKTPKTIRTIKIDESKDYFNSLNDSVSYFLNHVKHKRSFNKKIIDISINSNSLII